MVTEPNLIISNLHLAVDFLGYATSKLNNEIKEQKEKAQKLQRSQSVSLHEQLQEMLDRTTKGRL
jgi:hypothetical protein